MKVWVPTLALIILPLGGCADVTGYVRETVRGGGPERTFEQLLRRAHAGEAESQYAVGFMLFFGETVPVNRPVAHRWLHLAAAQGHLQAQLDLAVIHVRGMGLERDRAEAERFFGLARENPSGRGDARLAAVGSGGVAELAALVFPAEGGEVAPGERVYTTFCAGCHGLNGLAAYGGSPSFALGERLDKTDPALLLSIMGGKRVMPTWEGKLARQDLVAALGFVRGLARRYRLGVSQVPRDPPGLYFLFGPMRHDDLAYRKAEPEGRGAPPPARLSPRWHTRSPGGPF